MASINKFSDTFSSFRRLTQMQLNFLCLTIIYSPLVEGHEKNGEKKHVRLWAVRFVCRSCTWVSTCMCVLWWRIHTKACKILTSERWNGHWIMNLVLPSVKQQRELNYLVVSCYCHSTMGFVFCFIHVFLFMLVTSSQYPDLASSADCCMEYLISYCHSYLL